MTPAEILAVGKVALSALDDLVKYLIGKREDLATQLLQLESDIAKAEQDRPKDT